MEKRTFKFTESSVIRLLAGRKVIAEAGVYPEPITVGHISTENKEGNPFYWDDPETGQPDTSRPYAIVNLQALTQENVEKALDYIQNGEYELAVQRKDGEGVSNITINIPIVELEKMKIAKGMLVNATFDYRFNSEGDEVLVCTSIAPFIAKKADNPFAKLLKQQREAEKGAEGVKSSSTTSTAPENA